MRIRIAHKIMNGLFTLLILNASLATNLLVSASSSNQKQQAGNAPTRQESARNVDDQPLSPRLAALRDRLKSGDRDALDNFWKEISERGAPMIDPAEGSAPDVLVPIPWQATST